MSGEYLLLCGALMLLAVSVVTGPITATSAIAFAVIIVALSLGFFFWNVRRAMWVDENEQPIDPPELPIHDAAVQAIRERGAMVAEGWRP